MIEKRPEGWYVLSEERKSLGGPYRSRGAAEKRLRQVEMFKHRRKAARRKAGRG